MTKKIGIIGSGIVAKSLAKGFLENGYETMVGSRDSSKLQEWKSSEAGQVRLGNFSDAASFGDIIVLAVKGVHAQSALSLAGSSALKGKIVIDACNPISDDKPPVNGVLNFFTDQNASLMEALQNDHPEAHFVKAFNSVGAAHMVDPQFESAPTMFICGNNTAAKSEVAKIIERFGWEAADMGAVEAARAIEPLCMLWCIPGFQNNTWSHAFKLLK